MNVNQTHTRCIKSVLGSILLACFLFAFFPTLKSLISAWSNSDEFSHGFLILPICLYLVWRKRHTIKNTPIQPTYWGLGIALLSLLLYLVAHLAEIKTLSSISIVILMGGVVIYLWGLLIFKELMFPLFFLFFMIPVPSQIYAYLTIPLQLLVSQISAGLAQLASIPLYREGNLISLPDYTFHVVRACSGLRSMLSIMCLAAIFGYLTLRSNVLRGILLISGIPVAVFVNIIRVFLMIAIYYYFNYDLSHGSVHTLFGMIIFLIALIMVSVMKGVLSIWDKQAVRK
jgi:exosortase A